VDAKRHAELAALFGGSSAGLVYVTAFPNRSVMARYLSEIAWEQRVADAPTHLIHLNGFGFWGHTRPTSRVRAVVLDQGGLAALDTLPVSKRVLLVVKWLLKDRVTEQGCRPLLGR
jgi:hypothetical protein